MAAGLSDSLREFQQLFGSGGGSGGSGRANRALYESAESMRGFRPLATHPPGVRPMEMFDGTPQQKKAQMTATTPRERRLFITAHYEMRANANKDKAGDAVLLYPEWAHGKGPGQVLGDVRFLVDTTYVAVAGPREWPFLVHRVANGTGAALNESKATSYRPLSTTALQAYKRVLLYYHGADIGGVAGLRKLAAEYRLEHVTLTYTIPMPAALVKQGYAETFQLPLDVNCLIKEWSRPAAGKRARADAAIGDDDDDDGGGGEPPVPKPPKKRARVQVPDQQQQQQQPPLAVPVAAGVPRHGDSLRALLRLAERMPDVVRIFGAPVPAESVALLVPPSEMRASFGALVEFTAADRDTFPSLTSETSHWIETQLKSRDVVLYLSTYIARGAEAAAAAAKVGQDPHRIVPTAKALTDALVAAASPRFFVAAAVRDLLHLDRLSYTSADASDVMLAAFRSQKYGLSGVHHKIVRMLVAQENARSIWMPLALRLGFPLTTSATHSRQRRRGHPWSLAAAEEAGPLAVAAFLYMQASYWGAATEHVSHAGIVRPLLLHVDGHLVWLSVTTLTRDLVALVERTPAPANADLRAIAQPDEAPPANGVMRTIERVGASTTELTAGLEQLARGSAYFDLDLTYVAD